MAAHDLTAEFLTTYQRISLGDRALVAIAAHIEVRSVLRADQELRRRGLDDTLIGSYARRVSIWPGKDVDVFGRLMEDDTKSVRPDDAYAMFGRALQPFVDQGRVTLQPRSYKVDYRPGRLPDVKFLRTAAVTYGWETSRVDRVARELDQMAFEFSVDVVPAVGWGDHYGIPEVGLEVSTGERYRTGEWLLTDPVALTEVTQARNRAPRIGGIGAYVRTVKAIKQVKAHHLPDTKPSSLFYEFILYEGFTEGDIAGESWADITASALGYIFERLHTVGARPVCDPVLRQEFQPAPPHGDLAVATAVFDDLAQTANRARGASSRCQAAIEWRKVFGGNQQRAQVFPLPPGCRGTGAAMGLAATNVAAGGTAERSFGDR